MPPLFLCRKIKGVGEKSHLSIRQNEEKRGINEERIPLLIGKSSGIKKENVSSDWKNWKTQEK